MKAFLLLLAVALCSSLAFAEEDVEWSDPDPWVGLNQRIHDFNEVADRFIARPLARVYDAAMPRFARTGVSNFFQNLLDVNNAVNNLLQGKVLAGTSDVGRVLVNSTLGIGGLFDPATNMGLVKHQEDFGQTFSVWGIPRGPYLVIPFLGPSTVTDAFAIPFDSFTDPVSELYPVDHRNTLRGVRLIDVRAGLLSAEKLVFGDKYIFYRDSYMQRREYLINDGQVEDAFDDDF